jgi:hypothetical protein
MLQAIREHTTQQVVPLRQIQQLLVHDLYGVVFDARSKMSLKTVSKSEPIFPAPPPAVAHAITNRAMIAATSNISAYSVVAWPRERLCE